MDDIKIAISKRFINHFNERSSSKSKRIVYPDDMQISDKEASVSILSVCLVKNERSGRSRDFMKYKLMFSRKFNTASTITDLFCRLLVSSDPFITSSRHEPSKPDLELGLGIKEMIDTE